MLKLISISIFALAEYSFDYLAVGGSTNWSIFYFVCTYLSIALISVDLFVKDGSPSMRWCGLAFAFFFIILIIIELTHINMPFDDYIISVSDGKIKFVSYGLLVIVLLFITLMSWERRLSKK